MLGSLHGNASVILSRWVERKLFQSCHIGLRCALLLTRFRRYLSQFTRCPSRKNFILGSTGSNDDYAAMRPAQSGFSSASEASSSTRAA